MQNRQKYFIRASFAALIFVILGYAVKFDPQLIQGFDQGLQAGIRGSLPDFWTRLFKGITLLGNTPVQFTTLLLILVFFLWKKWYLEAGFLLLNGAIAGLFIMTLKNIYERPRPGISHLVHAGGYSFPSGHSMGTMMIIGTLVVVVHQRIKAQASRRLVEGLLALAIFLVGLSRIYLGVHYPSDVLAGFILGWGVLSLLYPFYDRLRFEWRFKGKQN